MQESLIKFNKFLQENELKRNRALKRITDERKQREVKEIEIKKLEQTLLNKIEEENNLKLKLEKNMKYQDYLENTVQNISKYFPEIIDILNRYKILKDANKSLILKQNNEELDQDKLNREYISYKKSKENQILNCNNEVAELQVLLENLKNKSSRLQQEMDQRMNEQTQKSLFLGQIITSVSNLLQRCEENFHRRHNKPMIDHNATTVNASLTASNTTTTGTVDKSMQDIQSIINQSEKTLSNLDWIALYINDFKDIRNDYIAEYGSMILNNTGNKVSSTRGSILTSASNPASTGHATGSNPNSAPNSSGNALISQEGLIHTSRPKSGVSNAASTGAMHG